MSWKDDFSCCFCGKEFGNDPIDLAVHIKENHEEPRKTVLINQ